MIRFAVLAAILCEYLASCALIADDDQIEDGEVRFRQLDLTLTTVLAENARLRNEISAQEMKLGERSVDKGADAWQTGTAQMKPAQEAAALLEIDSTPFVTTLDAVSASVNAVVAGKALASVRRKASLSESAPRLNIGHRVPVRAHKPERKKGLVPGIYTLQPLGCQNYVMSLPELRQTRSSDDSVIVGAVQDNGNSSLEQKDPSASALGSSSLLEVEQRNQRWILDNVGGEWTLESVDNARYLSTKVLKTVVGGLAKVVKKVDGSAKWVISEARIQKDDTTKESASDDDEDKLYTICQNSSGHCLGLPSLHNSTKR